MSPHYNGRIRTDGRAFVAADGSPFTWRGVSEFQLLWYLFDTSRSDAENEQLVTKRIDLRRAQGFTVLRVFTMVDWSPRFPVALRPADDYGRYKRAARRLLELTRERGMYVELTLFTDLGRTFPKSRMNEHLDFFAPLAEEFDNTFVEMVNEGFKNGLEREEVYVAGRRFRGKAPSVLLAGTSPADCGDSTCDDAAVENGHFVDGRYYADAPFNYVTLHSERSDGDDGWRWVRHLREGEMVGAATNKPVVQDEPIGSQATNEPGRRSNNPRHFRVAALLCHATLQYFTFHNQCAVSASVDPLCADVPAPGADEVGKSDILPSDPRGFRFVNGHWADSPIDGRQGFSSGSLLRLSSKVSGSGFYTVPVHVTKDVDLPVRFGGHVAVVEVDGGSVILERDFAPGEPLRLRAGQDVVIYGGNVPRGTIPKAVSACDDLAVPDDAFRACYYEGTGFGTFKNAEEVPALDFDWEEGSPMAGVPQDAFSARFTGTFNFAGGKTPFAVQSDDGVRMKIDGQIIVDDWNDHGVFPLVAEVALAAGRHVVEVEYYENTGLAALKVGFASIPSPGPGPKPSPGGETVPAQAAMARQTTPAYAASDAQRLVRRLYEAILGRGVDPSGLSTYSPLVAKGDLYRVVNALVMSDELRQRALTVPALSRALYAKLLDREADPGGDAFTQETIRSGDAAQRIFEIVRSPEYEAKN
jgi:hypothetical protein